MNSIQNEEYFEEDDKTYVKIEYDYSEETTVNWKKNENWEYFEEDDKTDLKILEQGDPEEIIENKEKIRKKSYENKSCNICMKSYSTQGNLERHVKVIHSGIKYPCNQCDHQATTNGSLKTHIQSVHEKIKYSCNQCNH